MRATFGPRLEKFVPAAYERRQRSLLLSWRAVVADKKARDTAVHAMRERHALSTAFFKYTLLPYFSS